MNVRTAITMHPLTNILDRQKKNIISQKHLTTSSNFLQRSRFIFIIIPLQILLTLTIWVRETLISLFRREKKSLELCLDLYRRIKNRISMGVQSFSNSELHLLGRRHEVSHVLNAFETIQNAGITNISMDLMYGLPHQTIETWERNIKAVITAAPQHISAYALTLEPETPMAHWVSKGTLPEQDSDLAADMYEWASVELAKAGYRNYEISNWALPGRESRHNIIYWRNLPYLGVGPGAHSFLGGYRFANGKSPLAYIAKVNAWTEPPVNLEVLLRENPGYVEDIEPMDRKTEMADSLIMGLRLADGVRNQDFQERFGLNLHEAYGDAIKETISLGLLRSSGMWPHATIRLTERGKLLANEAFLRFLGD